MPQSSLKGNCSNCGAYRKLKKTLCEDCRKWFKDIESLVRKDGEMLLAFNRKCLPESASTIEYEEQSAATQ